MKNFLAISIHYDYTQYGSAETATVQIRTPSSLCQLLRGDFDGLHAAVDWIFSLDSLRQYAEVFIILPYISYENKTLVTKLEKVFSEKWSTNEVRILSDVEAIAYFLICNNYLDGRYKVTDLEESTISVHYIDIRQNTFRHILSSEFPWVSLKIPGQVIKRDERETSIGQDSHKKAKDVLNNIYTEEFVGMDERYHCYRVEYGSNITYGDLKRNFQKWADEYADITRSVKVPDNFMPIKELYCGILSDLRFFTEPAIGKVEAIDLAKVKSFGSNGKNIDAIYPATAFDIALKTFSLEEKTALLIKKGTWRQDTLPATAHTHFMRLPRKPTQDPVLVIQFGETLCKHILSSACWTQLSGTLPRSGNGRYEWMETEIAASVDGCQNLVIHFKDGSTIVSSEIIGKL